MDDRRGRTPEQVVQLIQEAVAAKSQRAVSRETGIPLLNIQRYLSGIGYPTLPTMQKLADYFQVTFEIKIEPRPKAG